MMQVANAAVVIAVEDRLPSPQLLHGIHIWFRVFELAVAACKSSDMLGLRHVVVARFALGT